MAARHAGKWRGHQFGLVLIRTEFAAPRCDLHADARCPFARGRLTWVVVREVLADMRSWLTPRRLLSLTLVAGAVGFGVVEGVEAWWYKVELARADRELAAGRYGQALGRLERLSTRWTGRAEVEYPRGVCEAALGHVDAALAAWERVPRDSSLGAARSWTARGWRWIMAGSPLPRQASCWCW